jgi:hypothetical protein
MKRVVFPLFLALLLPGLVLAGEFHLKPNLVVILPEVSPPWSVATEPDEAMVASLAEHLQEEAKAAGKEITAQQAGQVALKQAKNNQLFVTNRDSGAHLLISFSPIEPGELLPSAKTVALSARSSAEGVADEGWAVISSEQAVTFINGAEFAQWLRIGYNYEGKPRLFMGIVGFAAPYWFWLYGNDYLQNPGDREFLEKLMLNIKIKVSKE